MERKCGLGGEDALAGGAKWEQNDVERSEGARGEILGARCAASGEAGADWLGDCTRGCFLSGACDWALTRESLGARHCESDKWFVRCVAVADSSSAVCCKCCVVQAPRDATRAGALRTIS